MKPGVTPEQAAAELNSIASWLEKTYPKDVGSLSYTLGRPTFNGDFLGRPVRAFVAGLMLLAGLILLAACANLGSLFAARTADRGREVALRLALGASRNRILRQLLTEAMIIALIGGAVGLWGSIALLRGLSGWQPLSRFPIHVPVHPDARVYGMALALALVSGVLFGLVPARQVRRTDPYQIIKAGPTGVAGRRIAVRDLLLVVQVAICALLVTSSMVAVRGLERSMHADVGFEPRNAMLMNTESGYGGLPRRRSARHAKTHDRCHAGDTRCRVRGIDQCPAVGSGLEHCHGLYRRNRRPAAIECRGQTVPLQDIPRILPCSGHSPALRKERHLA